MYLFRARRGGHSFYAWYGLTGNVLQATEEHPAKPSAPAVHETPAPAKPKAEPKLAPATGEQPEKALEKKATTPSTPEGTPLATEDKSEGMTPNFKLAEALPESDNLLPPAAKKVPELTDYTRLLEAGRELRKRKIWAEAEKVLGNLIQAASPMEVKRDALLELGLVAEESQQMTRAQQVYAQFIRTFPEDISVPDVYLRQGLIYRTMGAPNMALGKFYAVMSAALNLKLDHLEHYQRLYCARRLRSRILTICVAVTRMRRNSSNAC